MEYYQYFTAFSAFLFFVFVVFLIRRDSILMGAAFRWLILAIGVLLLGFYPQIADKVAQWVGIAYSPILPVIIACLLLMLKALIADIERASTQVKLDRLAQKMAILELKIEEYVPDRNKNSNK